MSPDLDALQTEEGLEIAPGVRVRRAIAELFGEAVTCQVVSVRRIPARTRRRVLKI